MLKLLVSFPLAVAGAILVAICVALAICIAFLICLALTLLLGPSAPKIHQYFTPSKFGDYGHSNNMPRTTPPPMPC